jgi:hypothetical protein
VRILAGAGICGRKLSAIHKLQYGESGPES